MPTWGGTIPASMEDMHQEHDNNAAVADDDGHAPGLQPLHDAEANPGQHDAGADDGDEDMNAIVELAEQNLAVQEHQWWQIEVGGRLVNNGLSPFEVYSLQTGLPQTCTMADATKVINFFGRSTGANAGARRLLQGLQEHSPQMPGVCFSLRSVGFSVAKHLMLQHRAEFNGDEITQAIPCSCFARTYIMPHGCVHKPALLHRNNWLKETLCDQCSTCLRCDKLLGWYGLLNYCFE